MRSSASGGSVLPAVLAGVAGEYYVAAELSRRGWVASITLRNTRGMDILVTNQNATRSITIQCKTTQQPGRVWLLDAKCEKYFSDNHLYVFVWFGELGVKPSFHVVPSDVVADHVRHYHNVWLQTAGQKGQAHNNTRMRKYSDPEGKYLERWDIIENLLDDH